MSVTDAPKLLTLDEVAERLRLSRRTVERMVAAEPLTAYRVSHRAVRVDEAELETWIYGSDDSAGSSPLFSRPDATASAVDDPTTGASRSPTAARGAQDTR
jgi:excisionase family DNA binding protein